MLRTFLKLRKHSKVQWQSTNLKTYQQQFPLCWKFSKTRRMPICVGSNVLTLGAALCEWTRVERQEKLTGHRGPPKSSLFTLSDSHFLLSFTICKSEDSKMKVSEKGNFGPVFSNWNLLPLKMHQNWVVTV